MRMTILAAVVISAVVTALSVTTSLSSAATGTPTTFEEAARTSAQTGRLLPQGVNPATCLGQPVVLIHGTWENGFDTWSKAAAALQAAGRCVYALNFGKGSDLIGRQAGVFGTGPIEKSAGELARFVDQVQKSPNASKVELIAHSQGGVVARYFLKYLGGAAKTSTLITLGTAQSGLLSPRLAQIAKRLTDAGVPVATGVEAVTGQAIAERLSSSRLLTDLNAGGATLPGITYTTINSRTDELNSELSQTQLPSGPSVRNIVVQDGCAQNRVGHFNLPYDPRVIAYVLRASGAPTQIPCTAGPSRL